MKDRARFAAGMATLGVPYNREITKPLAAIYWDAMADLTDDEFAMAVARVLKSERFFPVPSTLREYATPYVSRHALAAAAFSEVVKLGKWSPTGTRWSVRDVAEQLGPVAAEAFAACGYGAFEGEGLSDKNITWTRIRFTDAYVLAAEAQSRGREIVTALPRPYHKIADARLKQLTAGIGDGPLGA